MSQSEPPVGSSDKKRGFFRRSMAWLFSRRHFHFKLLSGTAAGVIVIVFLAGIFLYVTLRNHQQDILRARTIAIIRLSSRIENDIAALETGHRGFLLTGKPLYIDAFQSRRELIKRRTDDLNSLILDNLKERKRLMKVQGVVQTWLDTIALPEIQSRQAKNGTPATAEEAFARTESVALGNSLLDQAREVLQSLQETHLASRNEIGDNSRYRLRRCLN